MAVRGRRDRAGPRLRSGRRGVAPSPAAALAVGTVLLLSMSGCAESAPTGATTDVTVDLDAAPVWILATEPGTVIGAETGDDSVALGSIAGARLTDRRIVILDRLACEILVFDRQGALLRRLGGQGEGPGEFEWPLDLMLHGDSVAVWDSRLRRLTVFDGSGGLVRTTAVHTPLQNPTAVAWMDTGDVLVSEMRLALPARVGVGEPVPVSVYRVEEDGASLLLDELPDGTILLLARDMMTPGSVVFGGTLHLAGGGDAWWSAHGNERAIRKRGPTGDTLLTVVRVGTRRPVRDADVERHYQDLERDLPPSMGEWLALAREGQPVADSLPTLDAMLVDSADRVWLRDYALPGEATVSWHLLGGDGRALGKMDLPADWTLMDADEGAILVRMSDDLGRQRVALYDASPG